MHRHVVAPVRTARDLLREEREQVAAERAAFRRFESGVEDLSLPGSTSTGPSGVPSMRTTTLSTSVGGSSDPLAAVRCVYRETVMAVDHFGSVYDESLAEHLASELGQDIATGVVCGGPSTFTESFRETLLGAARTARTSREGLIDALDVESAALDDADRTLRDIVEAADDLRGTTRSGPLPARREDDGPECPCTRLAALQERCETTVTDRQRRLGDPVVDSHSLDGHALCRYLYHDADWTYPVLTAATTLADDLTALARTLDCEE
ncbi:DUF7260 family protein [Halomarina litorea]|uniref:DUF7260 family protein n=1 Tax=Halomarina litorea TaxID=2961595 RepID=UPI0020C36D6E|nr:hypothetical protein [Halomarina sp. BCD28]